MASYEVYVLRLARKLLVKVLNGVATEFRGVHFDRTAEHNRDGDQMEDGSVNAWPVVAIQQANVGELFCWTTLMLHGDNPALLLELSDGIFVHWGKHVRHVH